jgi:hypothetical protein
VDHHVHFVHEDASGSAFSRDVEQMDIEQQREPEREGQQEMESRLFRVSRVPHGGHEDSTILPFLLET